MDGAKLKFLELAGLGRNKLTFFGAEVDELECS